MRFFDSKHYFLVRFLIFCFLLFPAAALAVISEKIFFLNADGNSFVRYDTTRTGHNHYDIWFPKNGLQQPEMHLKDYLYLYPNKYHWDRTSEPGYDLMKIASGSFASMVQGKLDSTAEITVDENGIYTYTNWGGQQKTPDGYYGVWNKPDDFSQLVHAWVFPKNFNIISYSANRKGDWVQRNNTISFYANNVNNLVFTIKYQPSTNPIYREVSKALYQQDQVQLEQGALGVKITLAATLLFSSGSSQLTSEGEIVLSRLSSTLAQRDKIKLIIKGHSDNIVIKSDLVKKYKTNWELSSARSLTVLHYLAKKGIPESRLEAHAHGDTQPVADNETKEGRARNRRIEILLAITD